MRTHCVVLLLAVSALVSAPPVAAQDVAIKPGVLLISADHKPANGQTILIQKGKVVAVGARIKIPKGVRVIERPNAWVMPGFVDIDTRLSLDGDDDETTDPLASDVRVSSRIDPDHRDFLAARRAGITTCLVAPGDGNLFGGQAALVKTTGAAVTKTRPIVKVTLGPQMLRRDRPPTSRTGALALLRKTLAEQHGGGQGGILTRFAKGEAPALASVGSTADLVAMLKLQTKYGLQLVFRPSRLFPRDLRGVDLGGKAVALSGFRAELPALLAKAKAKLIFVTRQPAAPPVTLRRHAVSAARNGLDPKLALRAITKTPAEALGLGDRIGSLHKGCDGDLVVLDGPPLRLSTRVLEVFVNGKRVHRRPGKTRN